MARNRSKTKIAIAIDDILLNKIDALIDGTRLTNRSQAISHFVERSLQDLSVSSGVILLHQAHHGQSVRLYEDKAVLVHQLEFFSQHGIKRVYLSTQDGPKVAELETLAKTVPGIDFEVILQQAQGTAQALLAVKEHIEHEHFLVMSGDTLNQFNLSKMVLHHTQSGKLATMGLVDKDNVEQCSVVLVDGDTIINIENDSVSPQSHIVNAGVYIFRPEIFNMISPSMKSLEREVFPKLVGIKQLHGRFTHGPYMHFPELGDK